MSAFVIFPLMLGLSAVAHPLVLVLLKSQWEFTAVLLQIICFAMMWFPIHAINLNLLQVKGRSDLFLKLEIYKKIIGVTILVSTIPFGLVTMCFGQILSSVLSLVINTYYTGRLIKVGFWVQMRDLSPIIINSLIMWCLVLCVVNFLPVNNLIKLVSGIIIGISFYLSINKLTKSDNLIEFISLIKRNS